MKELQAELRAKQASIEEMSGSAKNARFKELEVRCRLSEQELSRQKEIARSWEEDRKIDMGALEDLTLTPTPTLTLTLTLTLTRTLTLTSSPSSMYLK